MKTPHEIQDVYFVRSIDGHFKRASGVYSGPPKLYTKGRAEAEAKRKNKRFTALGHAPAWEVVKANISLGEAYIP